MGKITIDICGGLGNQLFQIFAMIKLAKTNGMQFVLPNKYYLIQPNNTNKRHTYYNLFPSIDVQESLEGIRIQEQNFEYEPINIEPVKNYCFTGFFQSWKYVEGINPLDYIRLPKSDQNRLDDLKQKMRSEKKVLVSVHIRRGDYLKLSHFHHVVPIEYYKNASLTLKNLGIYNPLYVIFSDDIDWCKQNFEFLENKIFIQETDYVELFLMSSCDHHIIGNSSFSWWGAYLNENPYKHVIYPPKWFEIGINTKDLCPPKWIKC